MNGDQITWLSRYCDMDPERAGHFLTAAKGGKVPGPTLSAMKQKGLLLPDGGLTITGGVVYNLIKNIQASEFKPEPPALPEEILHGIDPTRAARTETIKNGYSPRLRSVHLKALRTVLLIPGVCLGHLTPAYGWGTFEDLKAAGLVKYPLLTSGQKFFRVYPTKEAPVLFKWIADVQGVSA